MENWCIASYILFSWISILTWNSYTDILTYYTDMRSEMFCLFWWVNESGKFYNPGLPSRYVSSEQYVV
jgi:hypothetical protein